MDCMKIDNHQILSDRLSDCKLSCNIRTGILYQIMVGIRKTKMSGSIIYQYKKMFTTIDHCYTATFPILAKYLYNCQQWSFLELCNSNQIRDKITQEKKYVGPISQVLEDFSVLHTSKEEGKA